VTFLAKITGSRFKAKTEKLIGIVEFNANRTQLIKAKLEVKVDTIKTGMSMRDQHMHNNYLEAKKYPSIVYTTENLPFNPNNSSSNKIIGKFSIHGKEKAAVADIKVTHVSQNKIILEGKFTLNILDYGIKQPKFMVVEMKPNIEIELLIVLQKK
tara:strand:+ start:167 stop:631 length:465 start_codon:yes stop_codon:yes gene_type:complete